MGSHGPADRHTHHTSRARLQDISQVQVSQSLGSYAHACTTTLSFYTPTCTHAVSHTLKAARVNHGL